MILPTQATFGLAATNLMQSMLDGMEEQRRQAEEKATGAKRDPAIEARISAGVDAKRAQDKIAEALFGVNNADPNKLKMQLIERLATKLGIDLDEERSNFSLGRAIEEAVKQLGLDSTQISKLEEELGLKAAGISLATAIDAIKNPYGDDNIRLLDGLSKAANGGRGNFDVARVVQRLKDVADPKTLEELKLGPQGHDPTRIEDAETRAERRQDIRALEASEKLEDVQEMQDAVKERNDKAARPVNTGETTPTASTAEDMILVLGATVEQTRDAAPGRDEPVQEPGTDDTTQGGALAAADGTEINEVNAEAVEAVTAEELTKTQADVLPISVDEIGLYELLKKKLAA